MECSLWILSSDPEKSLTFENVASGRRSRLVQLNFRVVILVYLVVLFYLSY